MRDWDLVLRGGRVIDPESGLDAVRDIAVAAARIAAIGAALPPALVDLDVAGQVLTSGFIDLHSHVSDLGGLRLQGMDGVTTALELEAGVTPVAEAYRRAAAQRRRGVRPGNAHRPGQLPGQHAAVGWDPARPGQRHLRGARRRDRGRRPARAPHSGRPALSLPGRSARGRSSNAAKL